MHARVFLLWSVITNALFYRAKKYLDLARKDAPITEILCGGQADDSHGWFVQPTVVRTRDPRHVLMSEEIFGPILSIYVYPDGMYLCIYKVCIFLTHVCFY